jgi:hypothetical protein
MVLGLDPPLDRPVDERLRAAGGRSVELEGGRRVRLDPTDSRSGGFAQVLDGLRRQQVPVYLELDPDTSAVQHVRVPHVSAVLAVRIVDRGVLDVVLATSHARHFLRESSEDFDVLRERLEHAVRTRTSVVLVEDDAHEIIDVSLPPPEMGGPTQAFPETPPRPWRPWRRSQESQGGVPARARLSVLWGCVSAATAQQVFNELQAVSCAPIAVPAPCIPFLYPDDGCWGRASEMCRLMQLRGLRPGKVWIQGWLNVATRNNPGCRVAWTWHVAPTLCVRGPGLLQRRSMVMDPSLFTTPVTKLQWKAVQGDPLAALTDTDASAFNLFYPPQATDPTYALTNSVLAYFRLVLQNRSINQGPPPYANCP